MSRNNIRIMVNEELQQYLIEEQERYERYLSALKYFEEDSADE